MTKRRFDKEKQNRSGLFEGDTAIEKAAGRKLLLQGSGWKLLCIAACLLMILFSFLPVLYQDFGDILDPRGEFPFPKEKIIRLSSDGTVFMAIAAAAIGIIGALFGKYLLPILAGAGVIALDFAECSRSYTVGGQKVVPERAYGAGFYGLLFAAAMAIVFAVIAWAGKRKQRAASAR